MGSSTGGGRVSWATKTLQRVVHYGQVVLRYTAHFGWARGLWYSLIDRPGRSGWISVRWPTFNRPFRLRTGGSDLRTFVHVVAEGGYRLDAPITPRVIVDAGANVGLSAAWFAQQHPDATIIAIEPDADNFELLRTNAGHHPNVACVRAALWSSGGKVGLDDPGQGPWAYRVGGGAAARTTTEVDAVTVLEIIERFDLDHIDLLKVDIEGSEVEVFETSGPWIDRVGAIAIELHDRFKPGCSRAFFAATTGFRDLGARGEDVFVVRDPSSSS